MTPIDGDHKDVGQRAQATVSLEDSRRSGLSSPGVRTAASPAAMATINTQSPRRENSVGPALRNATSPFSTSAVRRPDR